MKSKKSQARGWLVIAVMVIAASAGALLPTLWRKDRAPAGGLPAPAPLTGYPGTETEPSFSPDGRQVAFACSGDICIQGTDGAGLRRLTRSPEIEAEPAWSRDGKRIAFFRREPGGRSAVVVTTPEGGAERQLATIEPGRGLDWYPDGRWLAASVRLAPGGPFTIAWIGADSGEIRAVTQPPEGPFGDLWPSVSPSGRTLAAVRASAPGSGGIVLFRLEGDPPSAAETRQATRFSDWDTGWPAWTPDGRDLVFAAANRDGPGVWRLAMGTSRTPARLSELGPARGKVALSSSGTLLVFSRERDGGSEAGSDLMLVDGFR